MAPFPLALADILGHWGQYVVYLLIGIGFGFALEMSGFANSKILAAQFYFRDMTVLKVMFGAIVTAMVLVFLTSGLGLLDFNLVYVNETYLWPGIVGGLIMGVGFILGGFCPGTSLVAAAVGKIDGLIFVLGVMFGIFAFGETVGFYEEFWYSSYLGRLTIPDWLGLPYGVVVVGIVLMALFMFWGAEHLERIFGGRDLSKEPKWRLYAGGGLLGVALLVAFVGQPTTADRWAGIEATETARLANREVQIHPGRAGPDDDQWRHARKRSFSTCARKPTSTCSTCKTHATPRWRPCRAWWPNCAPRRPIRSSSSSATTRRRPRQRGSSCAPRACAAPTSWRAASTTGCAPLATPRSWPRTPSPARATTNWPSTSRRPSARPTASPRPMSSWRPTSPSRRESSWK